MTALATAGVFAVTLGYSPASGEPGGSKAAQARPSTDRPVAVSDDLPSPLAIAHKRDAQRQAALERKLTGETLSKRARHGDNQDIQLEREGTDRIFVVLVEFGDQRYPDPRFSDTPTPPIADPQPQRFDGPLHNQIPEPDRSVDNSTLWQADYNRAHYEDMYFNRMADYYERQSSGRYSVDGDVTEWVKVPFNEALYGRDYCGGIVCNTTKALIRDALAEWVQGQLDAGQTMTQITDYLKTFDIQDRYDIDGDGNYDEPDGFIDHLQVVHAGGDEASSDPVFGSDAIWSHRSYANLQAGGPGGLVGVDVGSNGGLVSSSLVPNNPTGIWAGDYTIQPENGGLGVFAHEYAHDLGLPDLYDTSGNTGGAENSTGFWTLMSSGSHLGDGSRNGGIDDHPNDLSAWELFQLGWLDPQGTKGPFYDVAFAGETSTHKLAGNVPSSKKGVQALFTVLPDREVPLELGDPATGSYMFWSDQGNDLNNTMTLTGTSGTSLTANVSYDIEEDWDYAFLEASTDGGGTWEPVATNLSDTSGDQSGFNSSQTGMTGNSGGWVAMTATLPAGTDAVRFRYQTDTAFVLSGFKVDDVAIDGTAVGTAETDTEGWDLAGFLRTTGHEVQKFFNAYVAENRQYDGYDRSLRTAYNFGFGGTDRPNWTEYFRYQPGMLIWYWNDEFTDNNVGDHPGQGLVLPIDASPQFRHWKDGNLMRPRIASYDSTFVWDRQADGIRLHLNGVADGIPPHRTSRVFDDTRSYWFDADQHASTGSHVGRYQPGWYSVDVPKTGTTISIVRQWGNGDVFLVKVAPR
ncbi:MAG: immune inhibitor A [Nocardioidaceae bacterium]